jgi:RsiW-degrading membrane proteinase PrsW (M82 family)
VSAIEAVVVILVLFAVWWACVWGCYWLAMGDPKPGEVVARLVFTGAVAAFSALGAAMVYEASRL